MATHDATLDGQQIQFERVELIEDDISINTQHDLWKTDAVYEKDLWVWGKTKGWILHCKEQAVNWVNSSAKALGTAMVTGGASSDGVLSFIVGKGVLHQVGTVNVYLTRVSVTYESKNIRKFDLTLVLKQD